jgi:hypothetical protein
MAMMMRRKSLPIRLHTQFAAFTCAVVFVLLTASAAFGLEHLHTLSPAYHATIVEAEESGTYTFHSPGISYGTVLGKTFGARIRLTFFFPVHLFQEGAYFHTRDYYSPAFGGEAMLGMSYKLHLIDDQRLVFDLGPSFNALKLDSKIYQSFMSATFGIGAGVEYSYPLNRVLTLGMFLSGAVHFLDFIHDTNGLKIGGFITAGITLGLSFEAAKETRR